jgi:uncharacterized protein YggE
MDTKNTTRMSFTLDLRAIVGVLLLVIIVMFALWQPWMPKGDDRTIEVTGQAKVTASPDEFVFSPSYQFMNADKQAALTQVAAKSDEIVKKLKELGVKDSGIKTNTSGYDYPVYKENTKTATYTLGLTITVSNKELAQKVQDYLVTTSPSGAVTPYANFSDSKRAELENQARDKATKDARSKAEQSAKNLGFALAAVKTVNDGAGFGGIMYPYARGGAELQAMDTSAKQITIQPGENDLTYTVTVTYFVR